MWRQNCFPVNSDSEQSISDEEEFDGDFGANCVSLSGERQKREGLQLQSQLELLKGAHELSTGEQIQNFSHEKHASLYVGDEVEMPDFPDEAGFIFCPTSESMQRPDEEVISDDEDYGALSKDFVSCGTKKFCKDMNFHRFGSGKDGACARSMVNEKAGVQVHMKENYSSSVVHAKINKYCKGIGRKSKQKYSFHYQSHKYGLYANAIPSEVYDGIERSDTIECGIADNLDPTLLKISPGENIKGSDIVPADAKVCRGGLVEHSMAELLDGFQNRNILLRGSSKKYGRRRGKMPQLVVKNSISPLGDRIIESESQPELLASGSSSDDEAICQNLELFKPEMKKQTMADRFQEALAATSWSNGGALVTAFKPSSVGLFKKLQQIKQDEKERDTEFLKKLQMGAGLNDEAGSIVVEILSRYLDAKLTVCSCSFYKNIEDSQCLQASQTLEDKGRKGTVIFTPRVCSNVDLEVGNLIRIYPPWEEVRIMGTGESIILSAYFSQS